MRTQDAVSPRERADGDESIKDRGLVGDGSFAALAGRDGWVRPAGPEGAGEVLLVPEQLRGSRQYYLPETGVLVTEMRCATGLVEVTDAFTLRPGDLGEDAPVARGDLLRYVRVLEGRASLRVSVLPRARAQADRYAGGLRLRPPSGPELHVLADPPLAGLETGFDAGCGEEFWLLVRCRGAGRVHHVHPRRLLDETVTAWRRWSAGIGYDGPDAEPVRRSALTLKLLGRIQDGATTAAASALALRRLGMIADADRVLAPVLDGAERDGTEQASGDLLDCAFQWAADGGRIDDPLWNRLAAVTERTRPGPPLTHSVALRQIALDRAARLVTLLGLPADPGLWSAEAARLTDRILREAWDEEQRCLTDRLGPGGALTGTVLALPARGVVAADHPRMVTTIRAIRDRLAAGSGLVFEYAPPHSGKASVTCSFQLANTLVEQGDRDAAGALHEAVCARASPLGLLPEHVDPGRGTVLDTAPHALSHASLIASALALRRPA